ncbi:hypothetical protein [Rhodococcus koreensis]
MINYAHAVAMLPSLADQIGPLLAGVRPQGWLDQPEERDRRGYTAAAREHLAELICEAFEIHTHGVTSRMVALVLADVVEYEMWANGPGDGPRPVPAHEGAIRALLAKSPFDEDEEFEEIVPLTVRRSD